METSQTETKTPGSRRAWVMFLVMLLLQGSVIGLVMNCNGILFAAIRSDLGFRAGDLSVYYMIRSFATALTITFTTGLVFRKNPRLVLAGLNGLFMISIAAMYFFHDLWQWYAAAVAAGIGSSCNSVIIPIVLNNWFRKNNGLVIGITMSASGIFGAVFSPIISGMISSFGWRLTALFMGGLGLCMAVLPSLLFLYLTPEEIGERPYGAEDGADLKSANAGGTAERHDNVPGFIFVCAVLVIMLISSQVQFASQLSTFTESIGLGIAAGAALNSVLMIGNLSGKVILGFLSDRIGIYRSLGAFILVIGLGMGLYLAGSLTVSPALLRAASICFGMAYSVGATGASLVLLDLYGRDGYKAKLSRLQAVNTLVAAVLSIAFPYIYDFTGSFNPVFVYGILASAAAFLILLRLYAYSRGRRSSSVD